MDAALPSRTTSTSVVSTSDVSDRDLLRLSQSRPRPILGWLSNGAAFQPLLVPVLGLPLLFAGLFGGMTTEGAAWTLQWTSAVSADTVEARLDPAARPDAVCPVQPPLVDWLVRAVGDTTGLPVDRPLPPLLIVCAFAMMWSVCGLAKGVAGAPVGLIAAVLVAVDTRFPALARNTSPAAAALLAAVLALRWLIDHQRKEGAWASWALLASGVSLGLTALINGPLAMAVVAVAGVATGARLATGGRVTALAGAEPVASTGAARMGEGTLPSRPHWSRTDWWKPFRGKALPLAGSFCLWCLTGFAVAGWWWLMMAGRHGAVMWTVDPWLANGLAAAEDVGWLGNVPPSDRVLGELGATWLPLAVLGIVALSRGFDDRKLTAVARPFLLVWATVGVGLWLALSRGDWLSAMTADAWLLFARIPLAILAAIGLWHACERRFPDALTTAAFGSVAALAAINVLGIWRGQDGPWDDERIGRMMVGGMIAVWLAGAIARRSLTGHERARCLVWSLTLTVALGCGAAAAAAALSRPPANDREWTAWRTQINRIENADRCILLSAAKGGGRIAEPPLELLAHLRCRWPNIEVTRTQSWTTAASLVTRGAAATEPATTIIVACGRNGLGQIPGTGLNLRPSGPSCYPPGWEIATFLAGAP
jgi:hypothetical protein